MDTLKTITLKQMCQQMARLDAQKNPVAFSLKIWEFNTQNKRAGTLREYKGVTLMQKGRGNPYEKNPNHWENRTRNLKLPEGGIKKIHIIFVKEFNGITVVY